MDIYAAAENLAGEPGLYQHIREHEINRIRDQRPGAHDKSPSFGGLGPMWSRFDPLAKAQMVNAILNAWGEALQQFDYRLERRWPGQKLATWVCGAGEGGSCNSVVGHLWRYDEHPKGPQLRVVVGSRSHKTFTMRVPDVGDLLIAGWELHRLGLKVPRTSSTATSLVSGGDDRVFYTVMPRRWGYEPIIEPLDEGHEKRERAIWDAERHAGLESVRMVHGTGWCGKNHGPFVIGPEQVNAAVARGKHARSRVLPRIP